MNTVGWTISMVASLVEFCSGRHIEGVMPCVSRASGALSLRYYFFSQI
jgi:hypothetical protein